MKKRNLLMKMLLVAALLGVGSSAWAYTETLTGADATTKDNAIAKTSFTMLSTYNPGGNTDINSKSCLKVRWQRSDASTGNTNGFALKVNPGYMITKVEAQMSGNSTDLVLADIKVDGTSYAGEYSKTLKGSGQSTKYTNITLTGISAQNYINFEYFDGGSSQQGYVYMTVTYVKINEWNFTDSGIWGSVTLPSAGNSYADVSYGADGRAATTGNFITFHSTEGKIVHPNTLTNGLGFSETGSTSNNYIKLSVPAGSTVTVFGYYSGNRTLTVSFNGSTTQLTSGGWADYSKDFINSGNEALDMYIYCNQNAGGASNAPYLKSISIKETVPVTINYRDKDDQENTLISSTVVNVEVGSSYTPTYTSPLYISDSDPYEYTYYSGANTTTINEATTFNILYSKSDRAEYTYTVNAIKNDDKAVIKQLASGTLYKGAGVTVPYPANFNVNGTLYTRGTTDSQFRQTVTPNKTGFVQTFPYVAQSTTNVVYLIEAEDIEGATKNTSSTNVSIRASNAAAASIPSGGVNICTLPAGTYTLYAAMHHTRNNAALTTTYGYGETEFTLQATATNRSSEKSHEFTLTETTTLVCKSISGDGLLDNLYITGTLPAPTFVVGSYDNEHGGFAITPNSYAIDGGSLTYSIDGGAATSCTAGETFYASGGTLVVKWSKDNYTSVSSVPVTLSVSGTIASSGYSSLASAYGLDFNNATGLTAAYVVTSITKDAVTLTSVDELPANSGVILKGTAGAAYSIPVKSTAAYDGVNKLQAAVTAMTLADGSFYILKNGEFCLVEGAADEAARTVPAGKAYLLKSDVPTAARALSFAFGDEEATGIGATLMNNEIVNGEFYNLQGQRVNSPKKGMYIVNGTKVIIK